jgi:two-component system chemotaxis response regulator CheB
MKFKKNESDFEIAVMGISAGGMNALSTILPALPCDFPLPLVIVHHRHPTSDSYLAHALDRKCEITVKEAEDKESIEPGVVYIAPPDYHLLTEDERIFSLSNDKRVNHARPSIDVLFESASDVYGSKIIGIVLTGANNDGSLGLKRIKQRGGLAIVQNPETAESSSMPKAAIAGARVDHILHLDQIAPFLVNLILKNNIGKKQ